MWSGNVSILSINNPKLNKLFANSSTKKINLKAVTSQKF